MHPRTRLTLCAALLGLSTAAWAQGAAPEFARRDANVHRADAGRALADANRSGGRLNAVAALLRQQGRDDMALASMREGVSHAGRNGVTHLRVEQVVEGLPVYGSYAKAAFNRNGELVHLIDHLAAVPAAALAMPAVDAAQALGAAMARVHPGVTAQFQAAGNRGNAQLFAGGAFFHNAAEVSAVAVPLDNGSLARGWLVQTWSQKGNQLHHTLVSGDGRVLNVENRTANDSYNIFPIDPGKGGQSVVTGPAPSPSAPSQLGWLGTGSQTTQSLTGNNVRSYLDTDANNGDDGGGTAVTSGTFDAAVNFGVAPSNATNKAVAAQNLFYLNNRIHDILYSHGFNESAGNFQVDNFGKGGAGGDAVNAEAQDGSGTDNANFSTPADGSAPRMQMYLWAGAGPSHNLKVGSSTNFPVMGAAFGPALTVGGKSGAVVTASPADGCRRVSGAVGGKIARIDRGTCEFALKVKNAQTAGAIGVIIVNNNTANPSEIFTMGGTGVVSIPSVMISYASGQALGASAPSATMSLLAAQPQPIDASLDSDIVYHEYCHGLTWRMIGGMSGPLAGAIGEGMGDGCAMLINGDDRMGEYSAGNPLGIRRYPYAAYPLKYGNVTGAEVHDDGEIYAAIVWRMIELFQPSGRDRLFGYIVEGMDFTPSTPKFENMRDGILAAVGSGNPNGDCTKVWQAFAQYGVGAGAKATIKGGRVTITQSTTPGTCD